MDLNTWYLTIGGNMPLKVYFIHCAMLEYTTGLKTVHKLFITIKTKIMQTIIVSIQERWAATRGVAHKNKKKYNRKGKDSAKSTVRKTLSSLCLIVLFSGCSQEPSQNIELSTAKDCFFHRVGIEAGIPWPSKDSSYYKMTTVYNSIEMEDIGTKKQIDSLKPIRRKQVIKNWNEYQKLQE
jgi:hypothetical protein